MATRDWRQEFEQVALTHLDSLFHMALRLCGNRADAEALGEETYLRAFRHFDQFAPGTNCRAWLFAILHNTFVNRLKREGREVLEPDEWGLERDQVQSSEAAATTRLRSRARTGLSANHGSSTGAPGMFPRRELFTH